MPRLFSYRIAVAVAAIVLSASVLIAEPPRVFASLELSALTITNDIAEATFKLAVKNEQEVSLSGVFVVFEDGFEVSVGDVAAESSTESDAVTRTFDLSQHLRTLNIAIPVTLKYAADGNAVEQATSVVLHLSE